MRALGLVLCLWACDDGHSVGDIDNVIGKHCVSNAACVKQCYTGITFPDGFCSTPCTSDRDCSPDTFCVDAGGGVCMFACPDFDCGRLGLAWNCRNRSDKGDSRIVTVCTGD